MVAALLADRAWIRERIATVGSAGYLPLRFEDAPDGAEFAALIEACSTEFRTFIDSGGFLGTTQQRGTGQAGVVTAGGEGDGRMAEVRSHVVVPWSVTKDHPLSAYWPFFYHPGNAPAALLEPATRLISRLRRLTSALFIELEMQQQLAVGSLSNAIAHGEGILRFHYYPPLPAVPIRNVRLDSVNAPIQAVHEVAPNIYQTWVSPHADMGHWTWQVAASDQRLAFQSDDVTVHPQDPGTLVGNACTYLAEQCPALAAPIHWVDLSRPGPDSRWSIAYFAHVRPGVRLGEQLAGERLYQDLAALGYGSPSDTATVRQLLAKPECGDSSMLDLIALHEVGVVA